MRDTTRTPLTTDSNLAVLLARVARSTQADLASLLAPYDVTPDQWRILEVLDTDTGDRGRSGWPMGELADTADLHGPTVTKSCDRLIERGLIYRRADDVDRRRVVVFLSTDGYRLLEQLRAQAETQQRRLEERLGAGDAARLVLLLETLLPRPSGSSALVASADRPTH